MDTIEFISQSLRQVHIRLVASCEGLTQDQVLWRPAPHANNIGFILWHVARGEDNLVCSVLSDGVAMWASAGLHKKFGQPADAPAPGDRMGLRALPIPSLETLLDYLGAAHARTLEFVSSLAVERLDANPDPANPGRTFGSSLRHLITHKNNHHGQIDYIRGLQDEVWDLPAGTGMNLS